ncbi:Component of the SF3b subcomplex of the U2 snRNP [Chytriomyces hyalinus]|nr:Component of the SF3b subcomplex of the U2 snRNP [Chytriomyces hyalinus]
MPKVKRGRKPPPEGWDLIEPTLEDLTRQMRDAENESHEGKRKAETSWPIFRIHHQRSRYIYEMYYKRKAISKELYDYCVKMGHADENLIAKWRKTGYEKLCCLRCIQPRDTNFGTTYAVDAHQEASHKASIDGKTGRPNQLGMFKRTKKGGAFNKKFKKKMSEIRQRKTAGGASNPTPTPANAKKPAPQANKNGGFSCMPLLLALVLIIGATVSTSFVLTKTLTFGYNPQALRKHFPRKTITLTTEELKQYDGKDPNKPVYLAINGRVYDVTAGRDKYYGPGGGYSFFSGVDAARAYITGCFQTHLTHDLRGLSQAEIDSLSTWSDFYEKHDIYFYVGQVVHEPIPDDAPLPEPCS